MSNYLEKYLNQIVAEGADNVTIIAHTEGKGATTASAGDGRTLISVLILEIETIYKALIRDKQISPAAIEASLDKFNKYLKERLLSTY